MEMPMDRLPVGVPAIVVKIGCKLDLIRRLRSFGMIPGTMVVIRYRSPGGSVAAFDCRGAVLALRSKDLKGVTVQWE